MKLFDWIDEKKKGIILFNIAIILSLVTPFVIYYIVSSFMINIYIIFNISNTFITNLLINSIISSIIMLLILKYVLGFSWTVRYKFSRPSENGVIYKNLDGMTIKTLIDRLEEYSTESLVLLKDNHIVIMGKDSIKLKED